MNTNESLVASLREQIDRKHREAIQALETVAGYLLEGSSPATVSVASKVPEAAAKAKASLRRKKTAVDRVFACLTSEPKTVDQIQEECNLPGTKVRAVLYSQFVEPKVVRTKIGNRAAFNLKSDIGHVNGDARTASETNDITAAGQVRELLAAHPEGLDTATITAIVGPQIEKHGGTKASIGAALYNMKKRGKLKHNEGTGIYVLAS